MSDVIEKSHARIMAPKASASAQMGHDPRFQGVLMQLYGLLNAAWQTDDPDLYSGDSDRLLAAGADLVMNMVRSEITEAQAESPLYNVAAQIKAAMMVPGDTPSAERLALIEQAGEILKHLLDDPKALDVWTAPAQKETLLVTGSTSITAAGKAATDLFGQCVYDIAHLADAIVLLSNTMHDDTLRAGALLRCYGVRITDLSSQLISFFDQDDGTTMGDVQRVLYRNVGQR